MRLSLRSDLPFVTLAVRYRDLSEEIAEVLVDTGPASTVLSSEVMARLGVVPEPGDRLRTLRGIGGRELVFTRRLDRVEVDGRGLDDFEVEVGGMDHGFAINGIIGMDFLMRSGAIVNLRDLTLDCG